MCSIKKKNQEITLINDIIKAAKYIGNGNDDIKPAIDAYLSFKKLDKKFECKDNIIVKK